jgi:hypothetical protein
MVPVSATMAGLTVTAVPPATTSDMMSPISLQLKRSEAARSTVCGMPALRLRAARITEVTSLLASGIKERPRS